MRKNHLSAVALLVGLLLLPATRSPLVAQELGQEVADPATSFLASTHVSAGYVINAPDQLVGGAVATVGSTWGGWGLYADFKLSVATPEGDDDFLDDMTAADAEALGDEHFGQLESAWQTINVAVVRALTDELAVYGGAGFSEETVYQEFFDDQKNRGVQGFYTVEDQREGGDVVNALAGVFIRATRNVMFQIGGETAPPGFTAGVSLVFPVDR